jgi:exodeoxyribonuclease-3
VKVTTLNVNGLRSAVRKGLYPWIASSGADFICLQETKIHADQRAKELELPDGYHGFFHDAQKRGYSGVAIYAKRPPDQVVEGTGWSDIDSEGRFLRFDWGGLSVVSVYLPSGTSGEARQAVKYDFMERFLELLQKFRSARREFIICGDWNIAHRAIDLKNWRGNQKHSGFLPDERAWLDKVFEELGYVDAFRVVNKEPDQYTWWSNRGQAWAKNVGWRIDYQIVTPGLQSAIRSASIYKSQRFSDHAPLTIEYEI